MCLRRIEAIFSNRMCAAREVQTKHKNWVTRELDSTSMPHNDGNQITYDNHPVEAMIVTNIDMFQDNYKLNITFIYM